MMVHIEYTAMNIYLVSLYCIVGSVTFKNLPNSINHMYVSLFSVMAMAMSRPISHSWIHRQIDFASHPKKHS
jgi:hypothetical protein